MESIRIASGGIPIEVNDRGDTIELRTDAEFMKACLRMSDSFEAAHKEYQEVIGNESATMEQMDAAIDKIFKDTDAAIDNLFGVGASDKIFPARRSTMQYSSFFEQLFRIIAKQQDTVADKYLANREQRRKKK